MKRLLFILLFWAVLPACASAEDLDYRAFGQMPVQESGRIKPLDSLARVMIRRVHSSDSFESLPATQWLAFMLFKPEEAMRARMFSLPSEQAARMLGLEPHADHSYSFEELAVQLAPHRAFLSQLSQKDKSQLTHDEAEVVRIYSAANDFAELIGSFSLLLPLNDADAARALLHLPKDAPVTFFDIQKNRQALTGQLEAVEKRKGDTISNYTTEERSLAQIVARLNLQETLDQDNALVRVIPPAWGGEEWLSPWGVFRESGGSPQGASMLKDWRRAAYAYRAHDAKAWNDATVALHDLSVSMISGDEAWRLNLEYEYHRLMLLPLAAGLYALGLILALAGMREPRGVWLRAAKLLLLFGLGFHGTALLMRMLILMRPPVSTLYESLIFVSFVVMAAACLLAAKRNYAGLITGGATSLMLLLASWVFAGDSDTLGVLVAVLNTNFWLATHVVCITTGYATALVTGAIAHLYLFRRTVRREGEEALASLAKLLHRCALIALLFTSVGTMLGGIWADQSWGRFWGWDPKENGALLIVLWLIWLLHGRIARQLTAYSFAAWMALINVIVALAWIGVNLLSVGLHSYGFTDAAANGLVAFCGTEFTFVAGISLMQRLGRRGATAPISAG